MPQDVHLLLLVFVVSLNHVSATSSYYEHPRRLLHHMGVQSLNSSSEFKESDSMLTEASTQGLDPITHFAGYQSSKAPKIGYTGAMATFDVYGFPNLKKGEEIAAQIFVTDSNSLNGVVSGWEIDPEIYGDSKTHFFVYWTADAQKSTGCSNLDCVGFVPVNGAPITPGDTLEPSNGQTKITVKIFKSKEDGDWWMHFGHDINNLSPVGYWPKSLFTNMADHAEIIEWGGTTMSYKGDSSPPMGNGQWPGSKSASVQNVQYVDTNGQGYDPPIWPAGLHVFATHKKCYQASIFVDNMFYYGGPGGCTN